MTWKELAFEQLAAARRLNVPNRFYPRAACTRAYYAAYALLASRAPAGMAFPNGWKNPTHDQIPEIIRQLGGPDGRRIREIVSQLRHDREDADYRPWITVSAARSKEALRMCSELFQLLP